MSEKKITMRDLGLPKVTMSKKFRSYIIQAAAQLKYGKKVEKNIDMELQFANCINEHIYTVERLKVWRTGRTVFGCDDDFRRDIVDNIELQISKERLLRLGKKYKPLLGHDGNTSVLAFGRKYQGFGKLDTLKTFQSGSIHVNSDDYPKKLRNNYLHYFLQADSCCRPNRSEVVDQLPDEFLKRLLDFTLKARELRSKVTKLRAATDELLTGFKSVVRLCTEFSEFVPIIKLAHQMREEDSGKARCSDVAVYDAAKEFSDIMNGK